MAMPIRIDDSDPSVNYTGSWFKGGNPPEEYMGTTHGAITNGSTMSFTFNGTAVALYGTIGPINSDSDNQTTTSMYVLDEASAVTVTAPKSLTTQYGYAFFLSPQLADEQHTLTVTATDVVSDNTFWIDYLEYTPSSNTSSSSAPPPPLSSSPTSTSTLAGSASTALPSDDLDMSSGGHQHHSSQHSTTIVAAVLVPIILLLILALAGLFLFWRRRFARLRFAQSTYDKEAGLFDEPTVGGPPEAHIISPYISADSSPAGAGHTHALSDEAPPPQVPAKAHTTGHVPKGAHSRTIESSDAGEPGQEPPPAYAGV
ncbi:uncharacterized protein PHACADRAFT_254252 [Phanerochaete carnosa HHB-10118-sp]|uniref:Mid2 domain-containing protein n=1 Tax=Phanerochaete carnosa (strain HHB-10118-sp) TaxID=650164 RepID=K5WCD6_PHACS|nr:uncharacterized protein PHACADRAFT_254252 [Phanerochaete carnosa HHB-10118-sp]EKM56885.1 hypothetical protein PHACADRAFT_254252 [Phanerochaete carnosa HHB-10118-sp]